MGENRHLTGVNQLLRQFGEQLKHPEEFDKEGKALAQKVFLALQDKLDYVAEAHFAGSFGKNTDVLKPDLDLVVKVNNFMPEQYAEVLQEFEDILELNQDTLKIKEGSIERKTNFSIQFVFQNGMEVDLLPAANLSMEEVYSLISKDPEKYYNFSSCLVQNQKSFMASQDSFAHTLVRLVKFWFKSLHLGDVKFFGSGLVMELLGVAAAEAEQEFEGSPSLVRAFSKVLSMIQKWKSLKLVYKETSEGKWRRVPERELTSELVRNQTVGVQQILKREYFIVEPANPWNDLLHNLDTEVLRKLKRFAEETQSRLQAIMMGHPAYVTMNANKNEIQIDLFKLFEPQPANLQQVFPTGNPKHFLMGYAYRVSSPNPDMKVRNEIPMKRKEVELFIEAMKWNLSARVSTLCAEKYGNFTTTDIADAVKSMVKTNLQRELIDSTENNHDGYDVTLTVPYYIGTELYAVKFSMTWK